MNNEESDKKSKSDLSVCDIGSSPNTSSLAVTTGTTTVATATSTKNSRNKNLSGSSSVGVGNCNSSSGNINSSSSGSGSSSGGSSSGNANGKNMSTAKSIAAATNSSTTNFSSSSSNSNNNSKNSTSKPTTSAGSLGNISISALHQKHQLALLAVTAAQQSQSQQSSSSSTDIPVSTSTIIPSSLSSTNVALQNQTLENLVNNCKLASNTSSPTKSDTDTFSELQPRVTDLSESDEESVSEDEIPDSASESCGNDVDGNDDEDDGDDEDEDEDDEIRDPNDVSNKFLLEASTEQSRKLSALFEAAASEKAPVLRHATLAIDEATQALNKMRCARDSPRDKTIFSRTLIAACTDNDVTTVRQLLGKGNISINESTDDGESLLSMACSAGYYELAQVLLAMSAAQVEDKGQKDCTPLMEAASAGHLDIIRLLLSHKADVNAQCATGNTPLMFACAAGHVEIVKELLKAGANVEDQNENGHTPLMEAASAGHVEVAKVLLEHGAGINTHSNEFKESALTLACYKGHLNMVRFLLQAGADQEHKTDEMHTALMEASMDGHVEVARLLLDSGAQVNMPTDSFESPLTLAACGGHVELATLLIERGANIEEVNDEGYTPLMEAAREGHEDMVALLLSKGANINATTEETQETALTLACCGGFTEVAEFLIKQGADLELGASTPLMEAAQEGHTDLVRFLLENGANVHAQTQTGDTALTHACENGHTDAAEVLLYYGAELEHESEGGRTPLMKACRAGHICTVKFLISKGADVNKQTTSNDHTALSLACAGGHQSVVELLLKSGADPFHKLKDNSTMLIEAAKGGHIRVVETLFKYPHYLNNNSEAANNSITGSNNNSTNNNNGQIQMQPINLSQQKQLQQQLQQLTAPPGLHEVPEAVRVSNQQLFHQQQFQSMDYLDEQMIANTAAAAAAAEGFAMDPNSRNAQQQQNDAIFAKMRLFQLQAGFEDGFTHGLARAQPGVVNQIINQTTANNITNSNNNSAINNQQTSTTIQTNLTTTTNNNINNANQNTSTIITKQKSLLRKNRQPPAPFELNLTSSEAQQVRSQPLGEDDGSSVYIPTNMLPSPSEDQQRRKMIEEFQKKANIQLIREDDNSSVYVTTNINASEEQQQQRKKIIEEFQKKANIQLVCDLPSAYVDITTASAQGAKAVEGNNSFLLTTTSLPTLQTSTTSVSNAVTSLPSQQKPQLKIFSKIQQPQSTITGYTTTATTTSTTTSTQITTPSEVSQSTAISDRPKVKPVSKKDGKNLRKTSTVLQQNQMPLLLTTTEPIYQQSHQQDLSNISVAGQQIQQTNSSQATLQQAVQQMSANNINSSQASLLQKITEMNALSANTSSTSSSSDSASSSSAASSSSSTDQEDQLTKPALNTQLNRKMLQMVAQIPPNHPIQKLAQRLIVDQPKSPTETPPASESEKSPDSPTKSTKFLQSDMSLTLSNHVLSETDTDFVDISRALREAVHDFRPDLNASEIVQVLQPISNLIPHKSGSINNVGQQFTIQQQEKSQHNQGTFASQHEEHFRMYPVDSADDESIGDCGIYPALDDSLDTFTGEDDGTRDQICSYELGLGDCMEEFFSVFQGVNDPAFQELTTNLNCSEFAEFGINSFCKTRWAGQWVPPQQAQELLNHQAVAATAGATNLCITDDQTVEQRQANQILIDHQLQQQLQHRLSVEEMQMYNQLQNQHQQTTLSLIPISADDQQQPPNIGIQTLPSQTDIQSQQQQTQTNSPNISSSLLQAAATSIQQSQLLPQPIQQQQQQQQQHQQHQQQQQQQQPHQILSADTQQQPKFVLNVDADKSSQSLQLLFQLPQQGQQQQPTTAIVGQQHQNQQLPQQQQQASQAIAQTQTAACQPVQTQINQSNTNLQQHSVLARQVLQQQCAQHSQVGISQCSTVITNSFKKTTATQTQQPPTGSGSIVSSIPTGTQFCASVPTSNDGGTMSSQQQTSTAKASGGTAKKSLDKATRKERNRFSVMRQTPAGSQANTTTQQFPAQGVAAADKTIDVDSETDSNHDTALTLACAGGHEELVELLINRGANIEHRDKKGFTPLILAATAGHEKVVDILLKHGAELEAQSERTKDTPLSLACSGGRYEVVELLLSVGANKEHRNVSDYTPLSLAASGGYVNIIKLLLSHGAEINSRTGSKLGISPLMLAAMNGHTAAVKLLLDMGSDINAQIETNRNTALTLACFQGRHEVVSLLLDRKANVEHRAKTGLTPLMEAASGGYIEVGRVLLDKGADVNAAPVPTSRDTALTIAADKGHLKFVELLLSRGAAVEVKNKKGNSPLWLAAHGGHLSVVEVLNAHGADIDSQDNRRVSCLMAAFRKGHTKVVKWMVQHVTQFPSDQEMTRFISTISDKELLEKCYDCVKIIRAAREAQAVKANENASNLLEELDMERNREESRRAAAARRRERKKKKKLEKKEEKRKMMESNNVSEQNAEKESEKEEDSDKEEMNGESNQNPDREEGDSGIDQGSCSSTDMKAGNVQVEKNNKNKNKKKKNNESKNVATSSNNRGSNSPLPVQPDERAPIKKKEEVNNNRSKKEPNVNKNEPKKQMEKQQIDQNMGKKEEPKKKEPALKDIGIKIKEKEKEKEKENVAPKEENLKLTKTVEKKPESTTSYIPKQQQQHQQQPQQQPQQQQQNENITNTNPIATGNRKSLVFTSRHTIEKDEINKSHRHHDDNKMNSTKPTPIWSKRGEDGWKEVVRKSSIQQQTSGSPLSEMTCKKVQVPVHAIARVIGRAGSNINAIRATTGAHIEVEKQGKAQSDRCITIKGLPDATKHAHVLISALIKDPDVDILQMLPKVNPSAKPPPLVVNSWDKNTPLTQSCIVSSSSSSTTSSSAGSQKGGKIVQSFTSSSCKPASTSCKSNSNSRPQGPKQSSQPPQSNRATSSSNSIGRVLHEYSTAQKRGASNLISQGGGQNTGDSLSSGTKTTMSYTNAIMSLKNGLPKTSSTSNNQHTIQSSGTFASKLTGLEKKNMNLNQSVTSQNLTQNQMSASFHSSPKKSMNLYEANGMIPFGNTRKATSMSSVSTMGGLPSTFTVASEANNVSAGRSITPIGPPSSANRNVTSSPLLQSASHSGPNEPVTPCSSTLAPTSSSKVIQPPGLVSQLQSKISHEYTLFNDSYNNQWESKQMYNSNTNDSLPKADASKAPGYNRGNVMSSPVSSKTSSNSATPPGSSMQTPGQAQNLNILPVSASTGSSSAPHSSSSQNGAGVSQPVVGETFNSSSSELNTVLKSTNQNVPAAPQPPASGLAIQRPSMQSRAMTSQIENNYGPIGSNSNRDQTQNSARGYFDQISNQGIVQQHSMNYQDTIQQQFHSHLSGGGVNQSNALQMSRLNPRASVFSQQNKSAQQLGGMFHQQNNANMNLNSYQKMQVASQNVNANSIPSYNSAPGRPQSQPQTGSNARWFNSSDYGYIPSSREILNLENGLAINSCSPAMSPNNPQQPQPNGIIAQPPNQPPPPPIPSDDNRKMPRPIGTERAASWKYNNYPNMTATMERDTAGNAAGQIPPWIIDKAQSQQQQQQQQPMQQNWAKSHQQYYVGDMHPQDHFQMTMDYHGSVPPFAAAIPAFQYPHFVGHAADMSQMPDKVEPWEHDKHGWSSNWTN